MIKKIGILFLSLGLFSCIQSKQFSEQAETPATITSVFDQLTKATQGNTPDKMQVGDYAYFQITGAIATEPPQAIGYSSYKVLSRSNTTVQLQNGNQTITADAIAFAIVATTYDASNPPVQQTQKEYDCDYVPQYKIWVNGCNGPTDLPPFQNYYLYNGFADDGQQIFYNLVTSSDVEGLPPLNVSGDKCYNFKNCQMDLNYVSLDVYGQNNAGTTERIHSINSFNTQLPFLASNPEQCSQTIEVIDSHEEPYEECLLLEEFDYGTPPTH